MTEYIDVQEVKCLVLQLVSICTDNQSESNTNGAGSAAAAGAIALAVAGVAFTIILLASIHRINP